MEKEKRKEVKDFLDNYLKGDIIPRITWISRVAPLSDMRDIALGYIVGEALAKIHATGLLVGPYPTDEVMSEIIGMLKQRLPKIVEKIEMELNKIYSGLED